MKSSQSNHELAKQEKMNQPLLIGCVLGGILLSIFSYFRFIQEEIAPFFPRYSDQGYYLRAAYEYFDYAQGHGFWELLKAHFGHNYSALGFNSASSLHMSFFASLLFPVVGASRLGALSVLVLSWASLLAISVWVFKLLSKRWEYSAWIVGLLFSSGFCFVGAGGMSDFRMDFPAACWNGVALLLWTLFLEQQTSRSASLACLCTFGLFFFRIFTLVYWGPTLLILFLYSLWELKKRRPTLFRIVFPRLLILGTATLLLLLWDRVFIYQYYFVAHNGEASIRRQAMGIINNGLGPLLYFPKSLWKNHLGFYARMEILMSGVGIGWILLRSKKFKRFSYFESWPTFVLNSFMILWPLLVLTIQPDRAPQVAGIAVPPLLILFVYVILKFSEGFDSSSVRKLSWLSLFVLFTGFVFWEQQLVLSTPFQGVARAEAVRLNRVFEKIAFHGQLASRGMSLHDYPQVAYLDWKDGFDHNSITAYARERLHLNLSFEMEVPRLIFSRTEQELRDSLSKAKAVIIPKNDEHLKTIPWPIMQSISGSFSKLNQFVKQNMYLADEFQYEGVAYQLFLTHEIQVVSPWPDWIPKHGAYIQLGHDFPSGGIVELRGEFFPGLVGQTITVTQNSNTNETSLKYTVPISVTREGEYIASLRPLTNVEKGGGDLYLSFSKSLDGKKNGDQRELALRFPKKVIFHLPDINSIE